MSYLHFQKLSWIEHTGMQVNRNEEEILLGIAIQEGDFPWDCSNKKYIPKS